MKRLTFDEIKSITFGAVKITEEENGVHFFKCTDKQNEAWRALSETLGTRALTTTGVHMEFYTDSKTLRFSFIQGGKFDIWIDGVLMRRINMDQFRKEDKVPEIDLGEGEKRVMIALPSHSIGVLSFVELDDSAFVRAAEFKTKMLFIGDSITQGYNADYDSLSYAYRTAMFFDAEYVIQGIGGAFYHESTFDEIPFDADTVIVAYGTNDFSRSKSIDEIYGHADKFLAQVKDYYAGKRLVALSPIWRADDQDRACGSFKQACDAVKNAAEKNGFEVIDGMKLVPHITEFFKDAHLHPNDLGFGLYAENLIKELNK
ncbi:MAG: SGNH/GDSL hydrolase family protein [Clostridia bacterium]|nr:SGNH/GDSL hydrolase family protein [Clostridia bacterium]